MMILNRSISITVLLIGLSVFLSAQSVYAKGAAGSAGRPNIVLILVDDLGFADIGAYNPDTFYETPNIDGLARKGAMFLDGYAANPVCSPSRFAVMTGKYPSRFAATDWFRTADWKPRFESRYSPADFERFLPLGETTIAEMLRANGYRTAFLGKWHLGEDEQYWPENQGFDVNVGGHSKGSPPGGYFSPYSNPRMESGPDGEYLPERLTSEAIDLLRSYEDDGEPYFLMLSYYTVHTPLQAPEETVEEYRGNQSEDDFEPDEQVWIGTAKERKTRVRQSHPVYAAMVEHLDTNVGRILHALKELGAEDDTIVIFTSDNGGLSTSEGSPTSNLPLRGGKGWLYEGGIRVPFIIAGPDLGANGSRISTPVSGIDLLPTIRELAGVAPGQKVDGHSLVPLLNGEAVAEGRSVFWHYPHYSNQGGFPGAAIRRGQYKLIERFEDGRTHLYDLSADPGEKNDLAKVHPGIATEMQEELHQWYEEVDARFLQPKQESTESPWRPDKKRAGQEYHVAKTGSDESAGSLAAPFLTIQAAAEQAQPGDVITVHEGTYRERIDPPRGGTADDRRIVYRAADGEEVSIKGSERIGDWEQVSDDTWKVTVPNSYFGAFNPYDDLIRGDWFRSNDRDHHTGAVYLNGHWLTEAAAKEDVLKPAGEQPLWFATVDENNTTLWAQFKGVNPNTEIVEINVRQSVFYPDKPGINYITVQGFTLEHAATPWAPPTAEQIGLIGTHWSKGWVIEDNTIRYSACSCVTLGKYGDEFDNTSDSSARGYVETIERALEDGWSKENVGYHIVRNNSVSHCEQAGIVGSMGAAFSTISGNEIHHIHMRRLYSGMEMAGIKLHGAIDTQIINNHVYRTWRGIWLDWMAQGARVSGNLLHDNETTQDLFVEVNHGPFLIDNNFFLSGNGLYDISNGGAYAHNLFAGRLITIPLERTTPYHKAHSTEIAGMESLYSGDTRFYNNIFTSQKERPVWPERVPEALDNQHYFGLAAYDNSLLPVSMDGNVFLGQAEPSTHEKDPLTDAGIEPGYELVEKEDGWYLQLAFDSAWLDQKRYLVTSALMGEAKIPGLRFEQPDGTTYQLSADNLGQERRPDHPAPGPLVAPGDENHWHKVW